MSSKRKFSEVSSADHSGAAETSQHAHDHRDSKNKKKKASSKVKPTSINWTKTRARTIERRLKRADGLPANVRHDLEKELDHHKLKLEDLADQKKRKDMISKYHMVRFFERKKADRLAKQIRTQLETSTDEEERKKFQADLHVAEVDSLYARYFPHRERYVSLYPVAALGLGARRGSKTEDVSMAARALQTERPPMWGTIENAAKKGTAALRQIMERKSAVDLGSKSAPQDETPSEHSSEAKAGQPKAESSGPVDSARPKGRRQQSPGPVSDDNDSDGGFFEEG